MNGSTRPLPGLVLCASSSLLTKSCQLSQRNVSPFTLSSHSHYAPRLPPRPASASFPGCMHPTPQTLPPQPLLKRSLNHALLPSKGPLLQLYYMDPPLPPSEAILGYISCLISQLPGEDSALGSPGRLGVPRHSLHTPASRPFLLHSPLRQHRGDQSLLHEDPMGSSPPPNIPNCC